MCLFWSNFYDRQGTATSEGEFMRTLVFEMGSRFHPFPFHSYYCIQSILQSFQTRNINTSPCTIGMFQSFCSLKAARLLLEARVTSIISCRRTFVAYGCGVLRLKVLEHATVELASLTESERACGGPRSEYYGAAVLSMKGAFLQILLLTRYGMHKSVVHLQSAVFPAHLCKTLIEHCQQMCSEA